MEPKKINISFIILFHINLIYYVLGQNEWCFKNPTHKHPCVYKFKGEDLFEIKHGETPNYFREVNNELKCKFKGIINIEDLRFVKSISISWAKKGIEMKDCSWSLFKFIFIDSNIMKHLKEKITYFQINGKEEMSPDGQWRPIETYEFPNLITKTFPNLEFIHILKVNVFTNIKSQFWPRNLWKLDIDYMGNKMLPQFINSSITDFKLKYCEYLENISSINSLTKLQNFTLYHSNDKMPSLPKGNLHK